jgi:hypothetical protein
LSNIAYFEKQFHPEMGEIIIDETLVQEQMQYLTIVGWTITENE